MNLPVFKSQIYDAPYNKTLSIRNIILISSIVIGITGYVLWKTGTNLGGAFTLIGFIGIIIYDRVDFGDRPTVGDPIAPLSINENGVQIGDQTFSIDQIRSLSISSGHWKDRRSKKGKNYFSSGTENTLTLVSDEKITSHHFMIINSNHLTNLNEVIESLQQMGLKIER